MKNPILTLQDVARRKSKQREIMGDQETHRQERIQLKGGNAAKDTIQRVADYKKARMNKASGETITLNRRKQEDLK